MTITLILIALSLVIGDAADAEMGQTEIARKVEKDFAVQVLRINPMTKAGRKVFAVTFMNPPGDRNDAYQVNTIIVDAETGDLVIQYRHSGNTLIVPAPPASVRNH